MPATTADLIDTHCHLAHEKLRQQIPDVLDRARSVGVTGRICAAATVQESRAAAEIASQFDGVWSTAGVHPHEAAAAGGDYLRAIEDLCEQPRTVALGEIGLDYHYDFSPRDDQRRVFAEQLDLARRLAVPVVIHTREAFDDTLAVLSDSGVDASTAAFHSFTGDASQVRRVLDIGAMVSFSGIVTFKNADDLRSAAALVDPDRLLVETDAPYLSPAPVRKIKTNEPANVAHVAACLASVRGTSPDAIAELTTRNAVRFFALDQA